MTRRRWIADEVSGERAAVTGEHAHHLAKVLRAHVGQEFDIATGSEVRRGSIITIGPERVEFNLGETVVEPAQTVITVALSIFKFDRMEWAIEKATELGVAHIIPVVAARTEVNLAKASAKRRERWQRIARQAAEQARLAGVPDVSETIRLKELLTLPADDRIVLSEVEQEMMLKNAVQSDAKSLVLAIGPEGGWKESELESFAAAGWISASIGPSILRAETAVIAALAVCQSVLQSR